MKTQRFIIATLALLLCLGADAKKKNTKDEFKEPRHGYNFMRGSELLSEGNLDEALIYFSADLMDEESTDQPYSYGEIATILSKQEKWGLALDALNFACNTMPKTDKMGTLKMHYYRAQAYEYIGDTARALADYDTCLIARNNDVNILSRRGQLYLQSNRFDLAEADFIAYKLQTEKENKNPADAYLGLATVYFNKGDYDKVLEMADKVIKINEFSSDAHYLRGRALSKLGRDKESIQAYFKTIESDVESDALNRLASPPEACYDYVVEQCDSLLLHNAQDSDAEFLTYLNAAILTVKVGVWAKQERNNDALAALLASKEPLFNELIANIYARLGAYDMAITMAKHNLEENSDSTDVSALCDIANYLYDSGDFKQAYRYANRAVNIEPDYADAYEQRGWILKTMGDLDKAEQDYRYCIALDDKAGNYLSLARVLRLKGGNTDEVRSLLRSAIEADTVSGSFYNNRPLCYALLGERENALKELEFCLANPVYRKTDNCHMAARTFAVLGDNENALRMLQMAFENGFRRFVHLDNDEFLSALKNSQQYVQLVAKYKQIGEREITDLEATFPCNQDNARYETVTTEVPLITEGISKIRKVACVVNGLPLQFIFDTGAAHVNISQTEAQFMLRNGYLSKNDITGTEYYGDAQGDLSVGKTINLREVKMGDIVLHDVKASITDNQKAPLLLGQSVFKQLGQIEIDNERNVLRITYKKRVED